MGREFLRFVGQNKKWWLAPVILVLLLLMGIVILGTVGATPVVYALF